MTYYYTTIQRGFLLAIVISYYTCLCYRIVEYSWVDGSGDDEGDVDGEWVSPDGKKMVAVRDLESIRNMNQNVSIYATNPRKKNRNFNQVNYTPCESEGDCGQDQTCNVYYQVCEPCRGFNDLCRRDENCCHDHTCMWGRCMRPKRDGSLFAVCKHDTDCKAKYCCARENGQSVCKRYTQEGGLCSVPEGGLQFSVHHPCPCAHGLYCKRIPGTRYRVCTKT